VDNLVEGSSRQGSRRRVERVSSAVDLPIKDDSSVTDEDVETRHLILFGDPGSKPV